MAKLDDKSSEVKTKKAKIVDAIVFTLLLLGAIAMVFPLIYGLEMITTSVQGEAGRSQGLM